MSKYEKYYRYSPFDGDYIKYVSEVIIDNKLFYSSPDSFNDPFDCKLHGLKFSTESLIDFNYKRHSHRFNSEIEKLKFKSMLIGKKVYMQSLSNQAIIDLQRKVNYFSVLCLSKSPNNILMFSHYANKHTGICFEFDIPSDDKYLQLEKVEYCDEYPILTFSEEEAELKRLAIALITTKASIWSYEEEYRSIRDTPQGHLSYPPEYLKGITIGCQAPTNTYDELSNMINKSGKIIDLYKARTSDSSFSLIAEKI